MDREKRTYWMGFIEKLSTDKDLVHMIPEVLEDLCRTFDFGCGFAYEGDHNLVFHLKASFVGYDTSQLKSAIDLVAELGHSLILDLAETPYVCFRDQETSSSALEKALSALLGVKSMVLVPVVGQDKRVIALVGLMDRRSKSIQAQESLQFSKSVISILANYIKMNLYQQQARNAQFSLEGILDHMGIDVYVNDFETHEILYLNRSMAAPYGTVDEMTGKICWQALYEDKTQACDFCPQKKLIDESGNPSKAYSWDYQRPLDGSWFRVFSCAFRWVDGRLAHVVSSVDITENKHNEGIIRKLAEYDYLTGLPNRYSLSQYIDAHVQQMPHKEKDLYVLFFDLDGFKKVNDTMGHEAGDELLRRIGETLQASPLTRNRCYRYGGDEFVILLDETTQDALQTLLSFLGQTFSTPWQLEAGSISVGASIGISHYPSDDRQTSELIRKADQAMYVSKHGRLGQAHSYNQGNICPAIPIAST